MKSGSSDIVKGRIETAAGALTGNDKLQAKGRRHQKVGAIKNAVKQNVEDVRESARKIIGSAGT